MKTILSLTLHLPNDSMIAAMSFPTASAANSYINRLTSDQSTGIVSLKKLQSNLYYIKTDYGLTGELAIRKVADSQVRFYLLKGVDGSYKETRMFTSRPNALGYVTRFLDEYNFDPDDDENKLGSWDMHADSINVKFSLKLSYLHNNSDDRLEQYYRVLGIDKSSTPEQIRSAYRKRSKQTHPDMGGSAAEFKKVNDAYEKLKNRSSINSHKVSLNEIISSPDSADIGYLLSEMKREVKKAYARQINNTSSDKSGAAGAIILGLIMAGIGLLATSASYNSAGEGGTYTIFTGLIAVGGYYVIRGIANLLK